MTSVLNKDELAYVRVKHTFLEIYVEDTGASGSGNSDSRCHSEPPSMGRASRIPNMMLDLGKCDDPNTLHSRLLDSSPQSQKAPPPSKAEDTFTSDGEHDDSTTLMVNNLPADLPRDEFLRAFFENGYSGFLDFVYMPMNFRGKGNFGYAFLNFTSHNMAVQAMAHMQRSEHADPDSSLSSQGWIGMWSHCQGFVSNVERYRNSPLMHELVAQEFQPAVYDCNGSRIPFPVPTQPIPKPRARKLGKAAGSDQHINESIQCRPGRSKCYQVFRRSPKI